MKFYRILNTFKFGNWFEGKKINKINRYDGKNVSFDKKKLQDNP